MCTPLYGFKSIAIMSLKSFDRDIPTTGLSFIDLNLLHVPHLSEISPISFVRSLSFIEASSINLSNCSLVEYVPKQRMEL